MKLSLHPFHFVEWRCGLPINAIREWSITLILTVFGEFLQSNGGINSLTLKSWRKHSWRVIFTILKHVGRMLEDWLPNYISHGNPNHNFHGELDASVQLLDGQKRNSSRIHWRQHRMNVMLTMWFEKISFMFRKTMSTKGLKNSELKNQGCTKEQGSVKARM